MSGQSPPSPVSRAFAVAAKATVGFGRRGQILTASGSSRARRIPHRGRPHAWSVCVQSETPFAFVERGIQHDYAAGGGRSGTRRTTRISHRPAPAQDAVSIARSRRPDGRFPSCADRHAAAGSSFWARTFARRIADRVSLQTSLAGASPFRLCSPARYQRGRGRHIDDGGAADRDQGTDVVDLAARMRGILASLFIVAWCHAAIWLLLTVGASRRRSPAVPRSSHWSQSGPSPFSSCHASRQMRLAVWRLRRPTSRSGPDGHRHAQRTRVARPRSNTIPADGRDLGAPIRCRRAGAAARARRLRSSPGSRRGGRIFDPSPLGRLYDTYAAQGPHTSGARCYPRWWRFCQVTSAIAATDLRRIGSSWSAAERHRRVYIEVMNMGLLTENRARRPELPGRHPELWRQVSVPVYHSATTA